MSGSPPSSRPPSLDSLAESTRRFREHNDAVERGGGSSWRMAIPTPHAGVGKTLGPAELAPAIRKANDERRARLDDCEPNVRAEAARACEVVRDAVLAGTVRESDVELLHIALRACLDTRPGSLCDMREAIARLDANLRNPAESR